MKILLAILASVAFAGVESAKAPLQINGSTVSHVATDGNCHVPKSFGKPAGSMLQTQGASCDGRWTSPDSIAVDSARVSHLADTAKRAGFADTARVAGLSDSAKALVRYARTTAVHDTADTLRKSIATKPVRHRFSISSTTGVPPLTLSYNNTTRVLTLTPTGTSFSWWWYGIEHVQPGPLVLPAHSATTGLYFAWFDSLGVVNIGTTPFDLLRCVPIALFDRNSTLAQTWVYPELHTDQITPLNHLARHTTVGSLLVPGGGAISGYTLNSDLLASVQYGIGSATLWDEDAKHSISSLADGGPYQVRYRTAPGVWSWAGSLTTPYRVGTTYITADIAGVQTELNGAGLGQYINYYVVLVPNLNGPQVVMFQGQAIHATAADAEAETWQALDKTGLPAVEFVPVWQITYWARSSYSGVTGRVQMVRAAAVGAASGTGAVAASTLQSAYAASPSPQIVTSVAAGPLTVQRGTASDTNAVIQVNNGAGAVVSRLNADGTYTGSAATLTTGRTIGATGDATGTSAAFNGSAAVSIPLTLATVNASVGTFGSASTVAVSTVNAKGLITGITTATITPAAIGAVPSASISGTAGQVAYFTGTNTVASSVNATFDPIGNLRIGSGSSALSVNPWIAVTQHTGTPGGGELWVSAAGDGSSDTHSGKLYFPNSRLIGLTTNQTKLQRKNGAAYATALEFATLTASDLALKFYGRISAADGINATGGPIQINGSDAITSARGGLLTALTVGSSTGFVRSASGVYSASPLVAGDVPTLNQNTTGSAATLTTGRTIGMTGDVVWTSPTFNGSANVTATSTIQPGAVTLAKMAAIPGTTILGNNTGGSLAPIALTSAQLQSMLGYVTGGPYLTATNPQWFGILKGSTGTTLALEPIGVAGGGILKAASGTGVVGAASAGDFPTLNQNTTGSAATLTTPRTLTIGGTGKAFDGSANVSWSLSEIGALGTANLTGTANQVAQFTATNTVASDAGFTTLKTSGITRYVTVGNGSQAGGAGFEANAPAGQAKAIGFKTAGTYNWELTSRATTHDLELYAYNLGTPIDKPLYITNASGGAIELGGTTLRPVAISGGLTLRQHATLSTYGAIYGSGVTPGLANYGLILSKNNDFATLNGAVNSALAVGNTERVTATTAGSTLTGTVNLASGAKLTVNGADAITSARAGDLTALKVGSTTGFVRSSAGTYSASALLSSEVTTALGYTPVQPSDLDYLAFANQRIPYGTGGAMTSSDGLKYDGTTLKVVTSTASAGVYVGSTGGYTAASFVSDWNGTTRFGIGSGTSGDYAVSIGSCSPAGAWDANTANLALPTGTLLMKDIYTYGTGGTGTYNVTLYSTDKGVFRANCSGGGVVFITLPASDLTGKIRFVINASTGTGSSYVNSTNTYGTGASMLVGEGSMWMFDGAKWARLH